MNFKLISTKICREKKLWPDFDNVFMIVPLFHGYGLFVTLSKLASGVNLLIMNRFSENTFLQTI